MGEPVRLQNARSLLVLSQAAILGDLALAQCASCANPRSAWVAMDVRSCRHTALRCLKTLEVLTGRGRSRRVWRECPPCQTRSLRNTRRPAVSEKVAARIAVAAERDIPLTAVCDTGARRSPPAILPSRCRRGDAQASRFFGAWPIALPETRGPGGRRRTSSDTRSCNRRCGIGRSSLGGWPPA